jgi:hypothetical protein
MTYGRFQYNRRGFGRSAEQKEVAPDLAQSREGVLEPERVNAHRLRDMGSQLGVPSSN